MYDITNCDIKFVRVKNRLVKSARQCLCDFLFLLRSGCTQTKEGEADGFEDGVFDCIAFPLIGAKAMIPGSVNFDGQFRFVRDGVEDQEVDMCP